MFCENCGYKIEDGSFFCENCGYKIETNSDFCENCDENFDQEITLSEIIKEPETEEPKTPKKKGKIALIITSIVLSVSIVIGSVFTVLYFLKDKYVPNPISDYHSYMFLEEGFTDVKIVDNKSAIKAVASVSDILGIKNPEEELSVTDVNKFENETFYRIQQNYNGIPVYGRTVSLACYKDGSSAALTSNYLTIPEDLSTKPKKSLKKAKKAAKKYIDADNIEFEDTEDNLIIFETVSSDVILAYYLNAINYGSFIIDANTAKVLSFSPHLNNADVEVYSKKDSNTKAMGTVKQTGKYSKKYSLYNSEYHISVFDIKRKNSKLGTNPKNNVLETFFDIGEKFNKDIISSKNNKFNHNAVIAFDTVIDISDFYKQLKFNGFDQIHVAINDSADEGTNSFGGSGIVDGKNCSCIYLGTEYDYSNKAGIGHEYTHGVFGSFVIYQHLWTNPIDAINEGYADIFATLIDANLNNKNAPSWNGGSRNIADPESTGYPNTMEDLLEAKTFEGYYNNQPITAYRLKDNNSGTATNYSHFASTIVSHAAYLMSNGIEGVNIDSNTLAKLWYKSMMLLQGTSDFSQCRNAVELSAKIMHKNGELTDAQLTTVSKAFELVGVTSAVTTHKYTTQNDFDLEIGVSDNNITLDKNSYLQSNFNLEVIKLDMGAQKIMHKENISDKYRLNLEDGYYRLLISDAKNEETTPINIYIRVDEKNDNAVDKIKLETDFTAIIVTNLQEEIPITNSTPKEYTTKLDNSIISIFEDMLNASEFVWSKGANFSKISVDDILGSYMLAYKVPSGVYGYFSEDPFAFIDENPDNVCHDPKGKFDVTCCLDADLADWILINVFNKTPDRTRVTDSYYYQGDTLYRSGGTGGGGPGGDYAVVGYKSLGKGKFELSVRMNYDGDLGYDYKFTASPKYDKEKGYYWSIYSYKMIIETETKPDNTISIPVIDGTDDKEQSSTKPLPKLPDDGYGRTRFYVNGMGIASGDRVSDVIAEGFTTKMDLSQVLEPKEWTGFQFNYNTSSGKSEIISVHVINETDKKRTIKDSRIYYLFLSTDQEDITIDNGTKLTKEYVNAKYEVNGKRTVGEPLNYIVLNNYNDNECGVTTIYLENVYPTMKFKEGALDYGNFNEVSACNMMKDYMDISGYLNDDEATRNSLLNEKLGKDVLSIKVENKTLNFGKNGSSMSSLINSGWRLPNSDLDGFEFSDEKLEKTLRVGEPDKNIFYSSTFNYMKTNDGKTVDDVEIANFGEIPITANEGKLSGIRLLCEDYYSYQNNDYVSFEFYDLSDKSSTIQDIIKRLGNPKQLTGQADINLVIMWYDFVDKDGIRFLIGITVDPLSNEMCNISIGHVAPQS